MYSIVQVAILYYGTNLDKQGCGGTLVGDRYVVTAAHCTDFISNPSKGSVQINTWNKFVGSFVLILKLLFSFFQKGI